MSDPGSIVERVGRAAREAIAGMSMGVQMRLGDDPSDTRWSVTTLMGQVVFSGTGDECLAYLHALAGRAAVRAMREPTDARLNAMTMLAPTWDNAVSLAKWKAGIDAAEQTQAPEPRGDAHPNHGAP